MKNVNFQDFLHINHIYHELSMKYEEKG
jgi:hypothetical protein